MNEPINNIQQEEIDVLNDNEDGENDEYLNVANATEDEDELDSSFTRYGFVHITKTGGTAIFRFLKKHYPEYFNTFRGQKAHSVRSDWVKKPILVIREPMERYISIYHYWKYGSNVWKRGSQWQPNVESIHDFTQKLKNKEPMKLNHSFTWRDHFLPQSEWLKPWNYNKTIVILYKKDLNQSIQDLLSYLDIPNKGVEMQKVNSTQTKEEINLTEEDIAYIYDRYKQDFKLYNLVTNHPEYFMKVI